MQKTVEQLQEEFDKKYITTTEIMDSLNISRVAVLNARRRGVLPDPIIVGGLKTYIWRRMDVAKNLRVWEASLIERRYGVADS